MLLLALALAAPLLATSPLPAATLRDSPTLPPEAPAAVSKGAELEGAESLTVAPEGAPFRLPMMCQIRYGDRNDNEQFS